MTNAQPSSTTTSDSGLILPGLDGSNPLGFLAALGMLRTLHLLAAETPVRLAWRPTGGTRLAQILGGGRDLDELVARLRVGLDASDPRPWTLDKRLPFDGQRLRDATLAALADASARERDVVDTLASFGVECLRDDKGAFRDTALRMVRAGDSAGSGLLAYGHRVREETTVDDLRRAIEGTWVHADERCALRWDPAEHHGYALQWTDPSKERTVSVRGANRLALAGLPLLAAIPSSRRVSTTGFGSPEGRTECLTWPVWEHPLGLNVVQSLLTLAELQERQPSRAMLRQRGVAAVYRCERIMTSTYYRNFSPARMIA